MITSSISKEDNDLLTQTGPDTPGGDFMRRYWQPVALAEELAPDAPPVPVRVLGEDLVLFRDGQGQLGLLGRWCSHRGTDLRFGEAEEAGIRCGYHGWLYDVRGRCLDQPMEPPESKFHEQIQHLAYPCQESGGVVFAYLGPNEPPLLPAYEFLSVPEDRRRATKYLQECNYLQANEGNVDPFQLLFLQRMLAKEGRAAKDLRVGEMGPAIEAEGTDFGVRLFTVRRLRPGATAVEVRNFMLPNLCAVAGVGVDGYTVHWHVPIDDTHHWRYVIAFRRDGPLTEEEAQRNGVEAAPGYRLARERLDFSFSDPDRMDPNYVVYAMALAESQGPIHDRTQEHLGTTDILIIRTRQRLIRAARALRDPGTLAAATMARSSTGAPRSRRQPRSVCRSRGAWRTHLEAGVGP